MRRSPSPAASSPSIGRFLLNLVQVLAVILVLNLLLSAYTWAPGRNLIRGLIILPETAVLVWAIILVQYLVESRRVRRIAHAVLGAATGIMVGFSAAEGFFQYYYARHFLPRSDIEMIRGAIFLFFGDIGATADVLTPVALVLIFTLLAVVGVVAVGGIGVLLHRVRVRLLAPAVVTVAAALTLVAAGLPPSLAAMSSLSWFDSGEATFTEVAATAGGEPAGVPAYDGDAGARIGDADAADSDAAASDRNSAAGAGGSPAPASPGSGQSRGTSEPTTTSAGQVDSAAQQAYRFPGLLDRDIYFFVLEAYGYATVRHPEISNAIAVPRAALADALEEKGYGIRTGYLESPVAGGYSWLAEATLLTGQVIDSQARFKQLYEVDLPTLTGMLQEGGYYTLTMRPGTVHSTWPEGWDFYRFEEAFVAHDGDFGYVGPWFSYVPITDQYTIWTAHNRIQELTAPSGAAADRPLLIYYQLVSSHTPFNKIPPIIDDWSDLGNGDIYNQRADEIQRFDNTWTGGTELVEGYTAAVTYVLEVLTDYVSRIMDHSRDPIVIVMGDHQAQPPIRGPENIKSVPVHVASRDGAILQRFAERGFETGMVGTQEPPHRHMSEFFPLFAELARNSSIAMEKIGQ